MLYKSEKNTHSRSANIIKYQKNKMQTLYSDEKEINNLLKLNNSDPPPPCFHTWYSPPGFPVFRYHGFWCHAFTQQSRRTVFTRLYFTNCWWYMIWWYVIYIICNTNTGFIHLKAELSALYWKPQKLFYLPIRVFIWIV